MNPKASTLQERMGFRDDELTTPRHDEIMLWLDENSHALFPAGNGVPWTEKEIQDATGSALEAAKEKWPLYLKTVPPLTDYQLKFPDYYTRDRITAGVPDEGRPAVRTEIATSIPPPRSSGLIRKIWEHPITTDSKFIVGFVDMRIDESMSILRLKRPAEWDGEFTWAETPTSPDSYATTTRHFIEVKPEIRSLGEVIRQIRTYQVHSSGKFYVCCPDGRFESALKSQGIGFIKALTNSPCPASS